MKKSENNKNKINKKAMRNNKKNQDEDIKNEESNRSNYCLFDSNNNEGLRNHGQNNYEKEDQKDLKHLFPNPGFRMNNENENRSSQISNFNRNNSNMNKNEREKNFEEHFTLFDNQNDNFNNINEKNKKLNKSTFILNSNNNNSIKKEEPINNNKFNEFKTQILKTKKKNNNNNNRSNPLKFKQKEKEEHKKTAEEIKKQEEEEKKKSVIRENLKCFICFGKVYKARMCIHCQKIACEKCFLSSLSKFRKCLNCKKEITENDLIPLPFLDNLSDYFISNIENPNPNNNIKNNNEEILPYEENKNKDLCPEHNKFLEHYCIQCNAKCCDGCLIFFNDDAKKHQNHTIIPLDELKTYDIEEAVKEYNKLKDTNNNIDNLLILCGMKVKEIEIDQSTCDKLIDDIKRALKERLSKKAAPLKQILNDLKNKKSIIESSLNSVPNSFQNIVSRKDYSQGKKICEELQKLNAINPSKEKIEKESNYTKNLIIEKFETGFFEFYLPEDPNFLEGQELISKDLEEIKDNKCKFEMKYLGRNLVMVLTMKVSKEELEIHSPKFYAHAIIQYKNKCEYSDAEFTGEVYYDETQVRTVDLVIDTLLSYRDINDKIKFKLLITKIYFK